MNKKFIIAITLISFLVLSSLVIAKGSSTYRTTEPVEIKETCEDKNSLQERIQCRLSEGSSTEVPEACLIPIQELCVAFYNTAGYCYDLPAAEKDTCFREESGYETNPEGDREKRFYITALLYELQEYVEDDFDTGKLTANQASILIADIVEIKRSLLSGQPLDFIKGKLDNYVIKRGIA